MFALAFNLLAFSVMGYVALKPDQALLAGVDRVASASTDEGNSSQASLIGAWIGAVVGAGGSSGGAVEPKAIDQYLGTQSNLDGAILPAGVYRFRDEATVSGAFQTERVHRGLTYPLLVALPSDPQVARLPSVDFVDPWYWVDMQELAQQVEAIEAGSSIEHPVVATSALAVTSDGRAEIEHDLFDGTASTATLAAHRHADGRAEIFSVIRCESSRLRFLENLQPLEPAPTSLTLHFEPPAGSGRTSHLVSLAVESPGEGFEPVLLVDASGSMRIESARIDP